MLYFLSAISCGRSPLQKPEGDAECKEGMQCSYERKFPFFHLPFPISTVSHFPFPFLCSGSPGVSSIKSCTTAQGFVLANQIAEERDVFNLS